MSYTRSRRKPARRPAATSKSRAAASRRSSKRADRGDDRAKDLVITESSGNVFLDVGFPPAEAENLLARAQLMDELSEIMRRRKLTQAKAAKLFGVTQPRVSDLMRGKMELFSVDSLLAMLWRAGAKVELRVRAA
jgi:predicted XRE-type DNA-binding protein